MCTGDIAVGRLESALIVPRDWQVAQPERDVDRWGRKEARGLRRGWWEELNGEAVVVSWRGRREGPRSQEEALMYEVAGLYKLCGCERGVRVVRCKERGLVQGRDKTDQGQSVPSSDER